MTLWAPGLLVVAFVLVQLVVAVRDSRRDTLAPFRRAPLPEAGPDAWHLAGAVRTGVWGSWPGGRLTVTADWIGVRTLTLGGVRTFLVERADVAHVAVVTGVPILFGAGIGVVGADGSSAIVVTGTNRTVAEARLDALGWPHERHRARYLRPFA